MGFGPFRKVSVRAFQRNVQDIIVLIGNDFQIVRKESVFFRRRGTVRGGDLNFNTIYQTEVSRKNYGVQTANNSVKVHVDGVFCIIGTGLYIVGKIVFRSIGRLKGAENRVVSTIIEIQKNYRGTCPKDTITKKVVGTLDIIHTRQTETTILNNEVNKEN